MSSKIFAWTFTADVRFSFISDKIESKGGKLQGTPLVAKCAHLI
jgi:hypothetical protein